MTETQRQFAESYAKAKKKLTGAEWAKRFKVTRRTIVNWLANPEICEAIDRLKEEVDVVVDREFVERLSPEERQDLQDLLQQQQRIGARPGSELTLKDLKELMIARAFRSSLREILDLIFYFEDMAEIFKGIEKDQRSDSLVRT